MLILGFDITSGKLNILDEVEIFEGKDFFLRMTQAYTHRFQCNFDLASYPFDTQVQLFFYFLIATLFSSQVCQIKMAVDHLEMETVTLVPDTLQMLEERDGIPIYTILDWRFKYCNGSNPNSGIVVEILLKRKILSELMTTYFPTILLVAITAATS